ncbi:hypothetical protein [Curtobacterium sp. MCJR17_043]|uniref:hypothetical protein n=1 Tax=Curtobacterium sp. MCJR17_043 TaxID=2175660 RepID=UPI0024DF8816|nr:hypothetical protein [Curtobacterium sp. MCJR17_043]WIB35062.1 hypothetical protein DEJ15_11395 [Curtobacterium sp. MCJR17_043]
MGRCSTTAIPPLPPPPGVPDSGDDPATAVGGPPTLPGLADLVRRRAEQDGDRSYLEDARSDRVLTYRALHDAVTAWSRTFDAIGMPASGGVLVDVGDPLAFAVVHLAAVASGRRSVPVDTGQPATEPARLAALLGGCGHGRLRPSGGRDRRRSAGRRCGRGHVPPDRGA